MDNQEIKESLRKSIPNIYKLLSYGYQLTPQYKRKIQALETTRSQRESNILKKIFNDNTCVHHGPFEGMKYLSQAHGSRLLPKITGCYEHPIQPWFVDAFKKSYSKAIVIGCAEGYYAVGLAYRMPDLKVLAYDHNEKAQLLCQDLSHMNGVASRIEIKGECSQTELNIHAGKNTLIICDIEGGEKSLLDMEGAKTLQYSDLIVETHDCVEEGITQTLIERFLDTHKIEIVYDHPIPIHKYEILKNASPQDQEFIINEHRPKGMCWLRLTALAT